MNVTFPDTKYLLQQVLDPQQEAVYLCDTNGFIIFYNEASAKLWGRRPEPGKEKWTGAWKTFDEKGKPFTPFLTEDIIKGKLSIQNMLVEKSDGKRTLVKSNLRYLHDDEGAHIGFIINCESVLSQNINQQKEAHLAAIVETSDDAIISKTLDGVITSWNAGAERIFGYSSDEMIGQLIFKLIPGNLWNEESMIQEHLRAGRRIDHYETIRINKNGDLLNVSLTISPIKDANGTVVGASKIARDITLQKAQEVSLRESEERYRLAIETARLGTWSFDIKNQHLAYSSETANIFGILNKALSWALMMDAIFTEDKDLVNARLQQAMTNADGGDYDIEYRVVHESKAIKWARVRGKVYFSPHGDAEKIIGTMLDITDEKTTKEILEQTVAERTADLSRMNEHLLKSNENLAQFAYIASHDLQEPLRKIQTFIDIIEKNGRLDPVPANYFHRIKSSAERMSSLVESILEYSRIDRQETQFVKTDLNLILREVIEDYETLINTTGTQIQSQQLPVIMGLPSQLRQLFANLISNAIKFCETTPSINIGARFLLNDQLPDGVPVLDSEHVLEISFTDNGIGFAQQYAEKIFQIFQRLHSKSTYKGTGIGLALCKKIIENHQGFIYAYGEPDKGSTFVILLPAHLVIMK
ncbi:PAS domain S-box protein [Pinibacter aurantiacus]|uniref:histidine kinase n=1 Tax=Pinibacter aurantiacus TaxID=2851599 RepID=A0A9E2S6P5_9BACT|nr:PAS domain S-box protein [Pinibacter aurantiacus]MBV4357578.1 PAS domain S-box protein [Pinibacter aurantiacus]